ncbi:MAG: cytidylate kinase-like family protein [Selenomonadaceae bacterium]|nr:cytidylate kinase-like family protein [Selenomonadaceae bacterium]
MEKNNLVVTVSRRYGCGGRELAGILAKKLDVKLYDRQLVHIAAAKLFINDLPDDDLYELASTVPPMDMTFLPFHSFGVKLDSGQYGRNIFMAESTVIKRLAEKKSCVILGRCADYVLRESENKFSIFVTADDDFRDKRGLTVYDGKTLKEMDEENKKRARYYEYYTDQTWGDASNYDLVVNTSHTPLEKIADGIIAYIESVKK